MSSKRNRRSWPSLLLIIILAVALFAAYKVFGPNTGSFTQGGYLYIHTGASYENVLETMQKDGFVKDAWSFNLLAERVGYPTHVHPGKYKINQGMSNYSMIKMLHAGRQTPVKLVINKLRTEKEFISLLSKNLEADSNELKKMFSDPVYLNEFGLNANTFMCSVMPDTYDFFWNTNADKAYRKIEKNYTLFWNEAHTAAAKTKGLSNNDAIIIASIVDEESNKNDEKPNIASVYLNRLGKGMKLQADPTVKFAVGDFTIRRITGVHLQTVSPYNTYMYAGLPPGPICTPSVSSIEAVLNAPKTDYLYFCAKEDFSGYHNFAATYEEQLKNARSYQQALNARGIH